MHAESTVCIEGTAQVKIKFGIKPISDKCVLKVSCSFNWPRKRKCRLDVSTP
jgi:hypothetical protein